MNITIASITFEIDDDLLSTETRAHFEKFISFNASSSVSKLFKIVRCTSNPLKQPERIINRLNCVHYAEINTGFIISTSQFSLKINFENSIIEVTPFPEWSIDKKADYKAMKLLVSIICVQFESILLHSSIVFRDNKALVFTGESGAGKSTLLRLLCTSYQVLNEEYNILSIENGKVIGYSTPFGRIKGKINEHPVVSSIFCINKSTSNKIVRNQNSKPFLKLIHNICTFPSTDAFTSKFFDTVTRISEIVSINDLYFTKCKSVAKVFN